MDRNLVKVTGTLIRPDGTRERKERTLVKEHTLTVFANGEELCRLSCSKEYLPELTAGYLFCAGVISGKEDIRGISFDDSGENVNVNLRRRGTDDFEGQDASSFGKQEPLLKPLPKTEWKEEWIFKIAKYFSGGLPLHNATMGTHACILACRDTVLFACEDFGRRNTALKAIGYAILNGIRLSECFLYVSGRILSDMTRQVIRAGIPLLASKAVPTADAVSLAKEYGLTLIVKAYPDQMEICD